MVTSKQKILFKIFDKAFKEKISIGLFGKYGIGKSSLVYEYALMKSKELNRELRIWHELNRDEKDEIMKNPEKYFVLVDIKGSMISLDNLIIPIPKGDKLVWETPEWMKLFSNEKSSGILFIDELNMTVPTLQSILYELIFQRKLGEYSIKGNVLVITAGNDLESSEVAKEIPKPLINRMLFINADELLIDLDSWLEYAKSKEFDERIIGWVLFNDKHITYSKDSMEQSTTPRSLELLNKMIKGENDIDYIKLVAKSLLEKNDATQFISFIVLYEKLKDIDKYINNVELIDNLSNEERIIIIMKISEKFVNDKIDIDKYYDFINRLSKKNKMLTAFALRYLKYQNTEKYKIIIDRIIKDGGNLYELIKGILEFENAL
jgi:hypothetical protein